MEPRLSQSQQQRQVLSPQIRQYLKLLQMPVMELSQAIEAEIEENPVLEESPESSSEISDGEVLEKQAASEHELEFDTTRSDSSEIAEEFDHLGFEKDLSGQPPADRQKRKDYSESLVTHHESVFDDLLKQIQILDLNEHDRQIAEYLIGNINHEGYLKTSLEEAAAQTNTSIEACEKVLREIQTLEPAGIAARTLEECLTLQILRLNPENQLAVRIVRHHLVELRKRDFRRIAKALQATEESVREAAHLISSLDPKPGRNLGDDENIEVIPDATVSFDDASREFKVDIHDEYIPSLRISPYYRKLLRAKNADAQTREFLREKIQRAMNFIKAVGLRKSTLREVTEILVRIQREFFEKGASHLVPLRLKDVSGEIGVHESTVSRAIHGKYLRTPHGTMPYKSFFSNRIESTSGEDESQTSMIEKMRKLIENESPDSPLSDQDIVNILNGEGHRIARRTIAKYREMMKILPSHLRKR